MEVASPEALPPRPPLRARWKSIAPYVLLAGVLVAAIAPRFIFAKQSEWQQVYVDTASQLRNGAALYGVGQPYVYPPFMASAATPFSYLSERWSRTAWLLVNVVAIFVSFRSIWRLTGGGRQLPGWDSLRSEHLVVWLGLACGGYYVIDALSHQQTDLVIAALLLRGCLAIREDRSILGGVLLGIAAGCKCTPLLFAPYLIWRGRWLACVVLMAAAVGVNLLPELICSSTSGKLWLVEWWDAYIAPQVRGDALPGVWASDVLYNQSLAGAFNRWTQTNWESEAARIVVGQTSNPLSAIELKRIVRLSQIGILLIAAIAFLHRPFRPIAAESSEGDGYRFGLECSLILILMLLLSPMSSKPHFCTLLLPGFCLARILVRAKRDVLLGCVLGAAILCGLLANKDLVKARIYTLVLWYGLVTISALLLGVGCGLTLLRCRGAQTTIGAAAEKLEQPARRRTAA